MKNKALAVVTALILTTALIVSGCAARVPAEEASSGNDITIDNVRDYVVGVDDPVELSDGTEVPLINFDNAATTPALKPVMDEIDEQLKMYGSIGRGTSQKSEHSSDVVEETRNKVLDFLNADSSKYTCVFVNSTTDGLNKLASALVETGNELVLATRMEHHSNDLSWRERCKVIYAEVDDQGRIRYDELERLLNENDVDYVTVTAASNVTGYVTDVHKVAKMAHEHGAKIIVDGAQIVAHRQFSMAGDTPEEDIDFFVFSAHKMYSPYGGGAIVGLTDVLEEHMPEVYGGGTILIVKDYEQEYTVVPNKYEAGSPDYPGIVGLGKAVEILKGIGFDKIEEHEKVLNHRLIDGLNKIDGVYMYGDTENIDDRVGVVTFNVKDANSAYVARYLSELGGVATRRGAFCANPYVWRLMGISDDEVDAFKDCTSANTPGMIRVSFGIYNTEEEVDRFLEVLPEAIKAAKEHQDEGPGIVHEY